MPGYKPTQSHFDTLERIITQLGLALKTAQQTHTLQLFMIDGPATGWQPQLSAYFEKSPGILLGIGMPGFAPSPFALLYTLILSLADQIEAVDDPRVNVFYEQFRSQVDWPAQSKSLASPFQEAWQALQKDILQPFQTQPAYTDRLFDVEKLYLPRRFTRLIGELARTQPLMLFFHHIQAADKDTLIALRQDVFPYLTELPIVCVLTLSSDVSDVLEGEGVKQELELFATQQPLTRLAYRHERSAFQEEVSDLWHNLPSVTQKVLMAAALQGVWFSLQTTARITGVSEAEVRQRISPLSDDAHPYVYPVATSAQHKNLSWYQFASVAHHRIARAALSPSDVHYTRWASAIQELFGNIEANLSAHRAWIREHSERKFEAIKDWMLAARYANTHKARDLALKYVEHGLKLLDESEESNSLREQMSFFLHIEEGRAQKGINGGQAAINCFEKTLEKMPLEHVQDYYVLARAGLHIGKALIEDQQLERGLEYLNKALDAGLEARYWELIPVIINTMVEPYWSQGQGECFLEICRQIIQECRSVNGEKGQIIAAKLWMNMGAFYWQGRQHQEASDAYCKALELLKTRDVPAMKARIYLWLTTINRFRQRYQDSLDNATQAIQYARKTMDRSIEALALLEKAKTLRQAGNIEESKQIVQASLTLLERTTELNILAEGEMAYGYLIEQLEDLERSKDYYQKARQHFQQIGNSKKEQEAQWNLVHIFCHTGYFQKGLELAQYLYQKGRQANALLPRLVSCDLMGDILRTMNVMREANRWHKEALAIYQEFPHQFLNQEAITRRFMLCFDLVDWNLNDAGLQWNAIERFYQQCAVQKSFYAYALIYWGRLQLSLGLIPAAIASLQEALTGLWATGGRTRIGQAKLNLGLAFLAQGELEQALQATEEARDEFLLTLPGHWRDTETYHLLARIYLALGDARKVQIYSEWAMTKFIELGLFHRVIQVEQILQLSEKTPPEQRALSTKELRFVFNHLGI